MLDVVDDAERKRIRANYGEGPYRKQECRQSINRRELSSSRTMTNRTSIICACRVSNRHKFCADIVLAALQEGVSGLTGALGFPQASVLLASPLLWMMSRWRSFPVAVFREGKTVLLVYIALE